ncbi:cleavage polyadenylation factor subunit fip1 [Puccinia graminis f. sp. tritici]|uniref:Cleavage polyadenylation factor subunit fip1 n=1 Tax=Puccinia graminis f. sp. tritici TaxID=56615 RepID=A0A5B0R1H9_PUCGR|nr:cleavage polyadenylation factor subunit fip1 [Puccinia graminis f. sp. tritici]
MRAKGARARRPHIGAPSTLYATQSGPLLIIFFLTQPVTLHPERTTPETLSSNPQCSRDNGRSWKTGWWSIGPTSRRTYTRIPTTTEQVHRAFELASNALIPPEPLPIPLPSHPVEPATAPVTQAPPIQATIDKHSQNQSIDIDGTGMVDEEEEVGDEQGLLEDSDEDLDIILEGDTSVAPTAPPSRPSTQPLRFETPCSSSNTINSSNSNSNNNNSSSSKHNNSQLDLGPQLT